MDNVVAQPTIQEEKAPLQSSSSHPHALAEPKEQPFTLFERDNKEPYTAKFFDVADYQALKNIEPEGLVAKINDIENYVKDKIVNDNYFDSTKTYQEIIDNIREILGIKEFEPAYQQIAKIHSFVSVNQPKAKEEVDKPIEKVNPNKQIQFNKRIDTQINKHIEKYIKTLDGQFKKIDQTLYKRVDDQLKKIGELKKVSKTIDKYLIKLR